MIEMTKLRSGIKFIYKFIIYEFKDNLAASVYIEKRNIFNEHCSMNSLIEHKNK